MPPHAPQPELLAPAGDWDALRAAVANGADAVYFGLSDFNARHRAANFTLAELPRVMEYLHGHNVRGYVTLNTLIFSDELAEVARFAAAVAEAGADAAIVQDLGLARLIHRLCPGLPLHGSTQMTLTEPRGIEFVHQLGIERVILARELALADIQKITTGTAVPVEVFVHGALCVAYSGQCLTSEALGGRSANRGQCAQACRLPYDLIVDGARRDLGDKAYLLSPQDLAAHDLVGDLAKLGVAGLKIEGRLKSAHYVAAATQTYRAALDAAAGGGRFAISPQQEQDLAQSFSRGFAHGFLNGANHQELVHGRFPKSRGLRVGTVVGKTGRGVIVEVSGFEFRVSGSAPSAPGSAGGFHREMPTGPVLKPGDGVVFDEGHPEQDEQGGRVFEVKPVSSFEFRVSSSGMAREPRGQAEHGFAARKQLRNSKPETRNSKLFAIILGAGDVHLPAIAIGSIVWKTDDPQVRRRLEHSFAREGVARRALVTVRVWAAVGAKLRIEMTDDTGHRAAAEWERPLEEARQHPLTVDLLRAQLGRLGDTPLELGAVELQTTTGPAQAVAAMVPKSVLNDLRRQAVETLLRQREQDHRHQIAEPQALAHLRQEAASSANSKPETFRGRNSRPSLYVLTRTLDQLAAILRDGPAVAGVYCDFEDVRRYQDAVARARQAGVPIALATLRIIKPGEDGLLRQIAECQPDALLVRNLAALAFYKEASGLKLPGMPDGIRAGTCRSGRAVFGPKHGVDGPPACHWSAVTVLRPADRPTGTARSGSDSLVPLSEVREPAIPTLPLIADYSLNVANELTAGLLAAAGVVRMVPSYDLNWKQLAAMLGRVDPGLFEVVIHQHMPMFHMEHCVFCHTLSNGKDYRDCGRPCDRHRVDLRDRVGVAHPLVADVGCRNTVFNGTAQSAAPYIQRMQELGIRHYRVELLRETGPEAVALVNHYARVLAGAEDGRSATRQLRVLHQLGVTAGTLDWE